MTQRADKRLRAIALARNPYPETLGGIANWRHAEWLRGFEGQPFLGHMSTVQYQVFQEGLSVFKAMALKKQKAKNEHS